MHDTIMNHASRTGARAATDPRAAEHEKNADYISELAAYHRQRMGRLEKKLAAAGTAYAAGADITYADLFVYTCVTTVLKCKGFTAFREGCGEAGPFAGCPTVLALAAKVGERRRSPRRRKPTRPPLSYTRLRFSSRRASPAARALHLLLIFVVVVVLLLVLVLLPRSPRPRNPTAATVDPMSLQATSTSPPPRPAIGHDLAVRRRARAARSQQLVLGQHDVARLERARRVDAVTFPIAPAPPPPSPSLSSPPPRSRRRRRARVRPSGPVARVRIEARRRPSAGSRRDATVARLIAARRPPQPRRAGPRAPRPRASAAAARRGHARVGERPHVPHLPSSARGRVRAARPSGPAAREHAPAPAAWRRRRTTRTARSSRRRRRSRRRGEREGRERAREERGRAAARTDAPRRRRRRRRLGRAPPAQQRAA